jgi:hypothetical protein
MTSEIRNDAGPSTTTASAATPNGTTDGDSSHESPMDDILADIRRIIKRDRHPPPEAGEDPAPGPPTELDSPCSSPYPAAAGPPTRCERPGTAGASAGPDP